MNEKQLSLLSRINELTLPGRAALARGDGPEAHDIMSRKHELIVELFGPDNSSTGTSFIDLSEACHLVGRYKEAREAINKAFEIYQRLDRHDQMLDRLEESMMDTCAMQGHSFEVERIAKLRIARLAEAGSQRELDYAMAQDRLASLYTQLQRYDDAIPLLKKSLPIFEHHLGPHAYDTGICCRFLSRALLASSQWHEAVEYAHRALESTKASRGEQSLSAAMMADECAVAVAFLARETRSSERAREALDLSEMAMRIFEAEQGPTGKETLIGRENNRKLRMMLSQTVPDASIDVPSDTREDERLVVPSLPFISHSYADKDAVEELRKLLPEWCRPIVFEPIRVPPHEFVSEKLISGVLGANGLIFIDSPTSNASFWTAFERDLAVRKNKKMVRFDPNTRSLTPYEVRPRKLWVAHLYHPDDASDVSKVMRWLVDERSFEAFDDVNHPPSAQIPPFAMQDVEKRRSFLFSIRSFGAVYLLFLSKKLMADPALRAHAAQQVTDHPGSTMVCWLDRPQAFFPPREVRILKRLPKERTYRFTARPLDAGFSVNQLDDLCVRLFWIIHQGREGDWFR